MKLLITVKDVAEFVPVSTNVSAALIEPHIRDAQTFDVRLPAGLYALLGTALADVLPEFSPEEFEGSEFDTMAAGAGWADLKLAKLWYEGVRPLLCCHAARRFITWHGTHLTPVGMEEQVQDPVRIPVSTSRRAVLSADVQAKCAHYAALLEVALRTYQGPRPAASCPPTRRRPQSGGLRISAL